MIQPRDKRDYLSINEAAPLLGVHRDTVLRWCQKYGLGYRPTPDSPWRIDPAKVAAFTVPRAAS